MSAVGNNSQAQAVTRRVAATYESSSSQKDRIAAAFLFVYWIVYENAIGYEATAVSFALTVAVDLVKLAFPLIALVLLGIPARWDRSTAVYLALFGLFLAWSAVPTALYANSSDYAEYLKLWPRAVFAVAAVALFRRSGGLNLLGKLTVSYAALALPQYVLAHLCTMFGVPLERMIYGNLMWAGPFGILGNTNSTGVIGGYEFFQLRGFWNEPSNAAAILFSSYYVAEYLARTGRSRLWRFLGRTCLIAGLLTFSLAGYAALAVAMFAGKITIFFRRQSLSRLMWVLLAVVILVGAVSSRFIFAMLGGGSETALVISGAQKLTEASEVDLSGGRLRVAADTIAVTQKYPWGIGVQNVIGKGAGTASGVPVIGNMSASAPFMWLLLAGVPGLLLLLAREGSVCLSAIQAIRAEPRNELLWQAYVCVVVQNVSYGTWMTASYFLVAAAVVASTGAWRKLDPLYFQTGGAGESGLSTASA